MQALIASRSLDRALALIREFQRGQPERQGGIPDALRCLGSAYLGRKQYDDAESLFREVLRIDDKTGTAISAMMNLAELNKEKGNRAAQLEWLQRAVSFTPVDDEDGYLSKRDYHSTAYRQLAIEAERDARWADAVANWRAWSPYTGWCGNQTEWIGIQRDERVTHGLLMLGRHIEAARDCALAVGERRDSAASAAQTLFDIYQRADQLADLRAITDDIQALAARDLRKQSGGAQLPESEALKFTQVWRLRKLMELERLRVEGNIDELVEICKGSPRAKKLPVALAEEAWVRGAAGDALARCGDRAITPLITAWSTGQSEHFPDPFLAVLAKHPSPKAWALIERLADSDTYEDVEALLELASKSGERGMALIKKLATGDNKRKAELAKRRLEYMAAFDAKPPGEWPAPRHGSLPSTYQSLRESAFEESRN